MDRRLLRPRWLLAHITVVAIVGLFVALGVWQLSRHEERQARNELGESRLTAPPVGLGSLLESATDLESLEFRRVTVTGEFAPEHEVLIRSQVHLGIAGFHVITPLVGENGQAVLVNRGWVDLTRDEVPVASAPPPPGSVRVEGWVELSKDRPPLGPEDPSQGRLDVLSRVDIKRIGQQQPTPLAPIYIVQVGERASELPVPVDQPEFTDQGPHLAYAIQWFGFAVIGAVGYLALVRRRLRTSA